MSPRRHTHRGLIAAAIAATAITSAAATTPAQAATGSTPDRGLGQQTATLPVVIDGIRYAPNAMHRFDRRPVYFRLSDDGKTLIGYTRLREYKRFLASRNLQLPAPNSSIHPVARAAAAGDPPDTVCTDNFLMGTCRDIQSGMGAANVSALNCDFWGCTEFLNNISSVKTRARSLMLFNNVGFNLAGCSCHDWHSVVTIGPGQQVDLGRLPLGSGNWNDRTESLYVFW